MKTLYRLTVATIVMFSFGASNCASYFVGYSQGLSLQFATVERVPGRVELPAPPQEALDKSNQVGLKALPTKPQST